MTNTTSAEEVLKTDVLGRVKTLRAWQEVLLDEFERSWVSGLKFAALVGINYQTFATWVQRRRRERGNSPLRAKSRPAPTIGAVEPLRLLEAVVKEASLATTGKPLRVRLPCGTQQEVRDVRQAALAAELLRTLGVRPC